MRSPEAFDAFYAEARDRLLHETYALTGDVPAARSAVRDAFAVAWHHWPKVARLDDAEAWVRPQAHRRALRRHVARPWRRHKGLDNDVRATLETLAKLTAPERKALVLTTLSSMPIADIAREVGLPQAQTESALQRASSRFSTALDIASTDVRARLEALRAPLANPRWPRAAAVRRSGTARRRTHTIIGSGAVVAAMLLSGTVVAAGGPAPSTLAQESALPDVTVLTPPPATPLALDDSSLLTSSQVKRFGPNLTWTESETSDNLAGSGLVMPCQQARFADPEGDGALMRSFSGSAASAERATAIQFMELSADETQAQTTFETTRGWYADCLDPRVQLLATEKVSRVGDVATVLTLRTWQDKPSRIAVGLARTGRLTVTTVVRSTGEPVSTKTAAVGLAAAVNAACGSAGAGVCAGPPKSRASAPFPVGKPPGLLAAVDLPPVVGAVGPWVGTDPERARVNFAATRCDETEFQGKGMKHTLTRTFLFPAKKGVDTFGLTQTVATMKADQAHTFLDEVRSRMTKCGKDNLGTTVTSLANRTSRDSELSVWAIDVELSDKKTIQFQMAIMRDGNAVSQVGFTPADEMTMAREDFVAIAERALERLSDLPSARTTKPTKPTKKEAS